jgi:hypothetical protein
MPITTLQVPAKAAIETLHARRDAYRTTGEYPFLIGNAEELERIQEGVDDASQDVDEIIADSMLVDLAAWKLSRRAEMEEYEWTKDQVVGEWPGEITQKGSIERPTGEVYLGLAKINEPWKLPAVLKYGGWNDCPEASVQCAFHRKWQAEFDAEIVSMSGDVVQCLVRNPPRTREAAMALAWEQYWYCSDIVEQGCESVSNLAATLISSDYWFFWWD